MCEILLPVSVCTETGQVFLRDAMRRPLAHFGEVRNVDGKVLDPEHWIEGEKREHIAQKFADTLNAS